MLRRSLHDPDARNNSQSGDVYLHRLSFAISNDVVCQCTYRVEDLFSFTVPRYLKTYFSTVNYQLAFYFVDRLYVADIQNYVVIILLDVYKRQFLRNVRSLTQIAGRAARHSQGNVILYADTCTDSMRFAIEQSNRPVSYTHLDVYKRQIRNRHNNCLFIRRGGNRSR